MTQSPAQTDWTTQKTEQPITLHGLGFVQVVLGPRQRLHVWHPKLPRRSCFKHSGIHDHRFSFDSCVIVGRVEHIVYTVQRAAEISEELAPTHRAYLHEGPRTKFGNRPWVDDGGMIVHPGTAYVIDARGDQPEYHFPAYAYHSSRAMGNGKAATLLTKTAEYEHGAHSLCLVGVEPDINFDRQQWHPGDLWEAVAEVLGDGLCAVYRTMAETWQAV